jgi:DNA-binding NtrC family response regulator
VDVRVVSATWAALGERVAEGTFREDLYHRIATLIVETPPLRQRRSDIPALSSALLSRVRDEVGDKHLSSAALARLVAYSWPGNVRELASVLYRAAVLAPCPEIDARHIESAIPRMGPHKAIGLSPLQARALLDENGGNVSAAARAAGVARSTFRTWLSRG